MPEKTAASSAYDQTVAVLTVSDAAPRPSRPFAAHDPFLGVELGGTYRVERVIGQGGMGLLYQAVHLRVDRRFAVKVIHVPLAQREDMRARFEREARVMGRVRSDHVVDVIDVVSAPDGRTCIVSELLEGQDLEEYLRAVGGKLAVHEAVALIRQCLRGLSAAHSLGVVHRDLKPGNLFLAAGSNGDITLKVLDFGVAKWSGDSEVTVTGVIVGTPAYMAPEQARGAAQADARSDVYSAGAVLYRMLTGQSPYQGSDPSGTLMRLMEEAPERPSQVEKSIPAALEAVIEKAMARDPEARFQTVEELDRALVAFDRGGHTVLTTGAEKASQNSAPREDLKTLGRRARLARPLAVLSLVGLSLTCGMSVAAVLALVVAGLSSAPSLRTAELLLIGLGALAGSGVSAFLALVPLRRAYRSGAMVQAFTARMLRITAAGAVTLGLLELGAILWSTFGLLRPASDAAWWAALRVVIAMAAATLTAHLTRKRA